MTPTECMSHLQLADHVELLRHARACNSVSKLCEVLHRTCDVAIRMCSEACLLASIATTWCALTGQKVWPK
jgi:hypothetical protein